MNFLNIFNFNKTYKDYRVTSDIYKNKNILSYSDLFKALGILQSIDKITTNEKYHYANLRANEKTLNDIYTFLKHNALMTKNKYSKIYTPKYLKSILAFDNLMYAPKSDITIPDGIIRVLNKHHKEFKEVTE